MTSIGKLVLGIALYACWGFSPALAGAHAAMPASSGHWHGARAHVSSLRPGIYIPVQAYYSGEDEVWPEESIRKHPVVTGAVPVVSYSGPAQMTVVPKALENAAAVPVGNHTARPKIIEIAGSAQRMHRRAATMPVRWMASSANVIEQY